MIRIFSIFLCLLCGLWPEGAVQAQSDHGFKFVRIQYGEGGGGQDGRGYGRGFGRGPQWAHDYPTAEENLHLALKRTTEVYVEGKPVVLRLTDKEIFNYPMLYLCEPGYWSMEEEAVENLREYLNRGGFLLFDDFGREIEWIQVAEEMKRVFPDLEPREIEPDHPIWSIFYDIDPVEAPSLVGGRGYMNKYDDTYIGFFDEKGRLMALACYNQDLGDGWEWPDRNFEEASTISFQMGVNFLIYALTH